MTTHWVLRTILSIECMCDVLPWKKGGVAVSEPTKTLTVRVSPEEHRAIRVYIASKGLTAQEYIKGLIEDDMKNATKEKEVYVVNE